MTGDIISKNFISENGIHTEHLTVGYDRIPLIRDINLSVGRGEILTLIGPNGSGKSTILKTITRQLREVEGTVFLGKDSMQKLKDSEVSKRLSMVMTERIKTELQTGREIVASGRYPYTGRFGVLSEQDWAKVDEAITLVHAEKVQEQDFMKISDGQRQRLMLARAICQDTDILILDEPTSYLDMGFKMDILANIRMLAREKKMAIIMSLHELDLAAKVSDIIASVKGAEIDRVGTPEEIFSGDYVQKLYSVPEKSFDPVTGEVFPGMGQAQRSPEVFVIGGAGDGIPVYNRLCRQNIPFAAGILQENDVEFATAQALAAEVVWEKAFYPAEAETEERARQLIDRGKKCICAVKTFGPLNEANKRLLLYAKEKGKLAE
uniref:ABC transporter ATP-binding protein n=1 Tax=Roseburia sp. TaxID=2049040 RepID=UPI003FEE2CA9